MALVVCPDCQTQVSDAALACPRCGRPMASPQSPTVTGAAKSAATLAADAAIRAGLLGFFLGLLLLSVVHAWEHNSTAYWAMRAVWENIGSILGYSVLAAFAFAAIGAPLGAIMNFRRGGDD